LGKKAIGDAKVNIGEDMSSGLNFFGSCGANDSIGRAASLNVEALNCAGIPHDIYRLPRPNSKGMLEYNSKEIHEYKVIDEALIASLRYRINIFHINARRVPLYFFRLGEDALKGFHNIGFWVHEMQTIPSYWARQIEFFSEIWTPSSLCQHAVAQSSNIPVLRFSHPVKENPASTRLKRILDGEAHSCFNFLSIFDVRSDAERKNPLGMVRAFTNAHLNNPRVRLIIKTRNLSHDELLAQKLTHIARQYPNIKILDGFMSESEISRLYEDTDAYVSLHRAEGFGLTIADAMSRGIPVIATGYSGNIDFCNSDVRLVAYALRHVGHDRPRYRSEDVWAEPDLEDATSAFTEMVSHHASWVRKALRARQRLQSEFSLQRVGALMKARIELIERGFSFHDDMTGRMPDFDFGISEGYGF